MQALIDQGVIGDFRAPNIMRFGITPLFINMDDIERATQIFEQILSDKTWQKPQFQNRSRVT
jgi:kynureninase